MKKRNKIIVGCASGVGGLGAIVLIALMCAGSFACWGPFSPLSDPRMREFPGNKEEFDVENVESLDNSPLEGKNIIYLGSSVTLGYTSLRTSFVEYIGKRDKTTYVKEAETGTTLVDDSFSSYVSRMKRIKEKKADMFVCQLSTNDASKNKNLGEISTNNKDTKTIVGAMNYIIDYARDRWECPILFYTNSYYENENYASMVNALNAIKDDKDIYVLDLYSDVEFNNLAEVDRNLYMHDEVHPCKAGYLKWWTPEFEKIMYTMI